jgi:D-threo-aldose 1-dehydrogenase
VLVAERTCLGRTAVEVTRLGLGGAPLAGLFHPVAEQDAQTVLDEALRRGIAYVDTAPLYGLGESERRVGHALAQRPRSSFTLSTKVGRLVRDEGSEADPLWPGAAGRRAEFDFSARGIRRSLEESLERLGLERVDILYIHDPDEHMEQALGEGIPVLVELRDEGFVGAIGAGMNNWQPLLRFVTEADLDCVLLAGRFTLLDQTALAELLPACLERGVSVVAGGVLNSGILADPRPGARFDYTPAPLELIERAQQLKSICRRHHVPLLAAALQFPLRHPAVASVLVGAASRAELEEDAAAFETPIPDEFWATLEADGLVPTVNA